MVNNKGKQVGARIKDPGVWDRFIQYVESKHDGKRFGVTGIELQKALNYYLENPEGAAKIHDIEKDHEIKINQMQNKINRLNKELLGMNDLKSKYDDLLNKYDKLRIKFDHLQERFNSSLMEINQLQNDLTTYKVALESLNGVGFIGRIRKKWSNNIQLLLTAGKEE